MQFSDFITAERVCIDATSLSKTAVLTQISQLLTDQKTEETQKLFDQFWKRETLGSTTIGFGVTIPHIRLENIDQVKGCFIKLKNPVDFCAEDKQPVDLVLGFVVPENNIEQHLITLATITKKFNESEFREACRKANCGEELYQLITKD